MSSKDEASPSKRELTRESVIRAAIDCIDQNGFHAAHTNRIAAAAGVSWGVIQYHFDDKDGLYQAVIEAIFKDFLGTLDDAHLDGGCLHERVSQLIAAAWTLMSRREYRVSLAILRNAGQDPSSRIDGQSQLAEWASKTSELWDRLFEGELHDAAQSASARHLLFATLRGLADEVNPPRHKEKNSVQPELDALGDAISYLLSRDVG